MKILQFAFGGDASHAFLPHNYTPNCAVYSGTHDNDTALGWYALAPEPERAYARTYLDSDRSDLAWAMIRAASASVARLAVFPLQDVLGLGSEARMNSPGTLGHWTWRFRWADVPAEAARRLAVLSAATGRAPFGRLAG
jgi:4-alpha-glucanotransferase